MLRTQEKPYSAAIRQRVRRQRVRRQRAQSALIKSQ